MPDGVFEKISEALSLSLNAITSQSTEAERQKARRAWPSLSEMEAIYVRLVLLYTAGNKQAASRILNVDRKTIDRMIKRHRLGILVILFNLAQW